MTKTEHQQLDALLDIADEEDSPLSEWEIEFLESLDSRRDRELSTKQAEVFDSLVRKHLIGE